MASTLRRISTKPFRENDCTGKEVTADHTIHDWGGRVMSWQCEEL
jgi:hypothetical protein